MRAMSVPELKLLVELRSPYLGKAVADLDPDDRARLLTYLKVDRIEDAHPSL